MIEPPHKAFGRATQTEAKVDDEPIDFNALRGGPADNGADYPRWMIPILIATFLGILLGAIYFIHVTLAFKTAVMLNVTDIFGPYPDFAVIFVMIPAFCGPFYFLIDYLRIKTNINPYTSPQGIAGTIVLFLVLGSLSLLPVSLIRHHSSAFARAHGYVRCSSPFDPQHIRVFALKSYVDTYGCPTYTVPQ